jgi:hypothetical protein
MEKFEDNENNHTKSVYFTVHTKLMRTPTPKILHLGSHVLPLMRSANKMVIDSQSQRAMPLCRAVKTGGPVRFGPAHSGFGLRRAELKKPG